MGDESHAGAVTYRSELWHFFIDTVPITLSFAFQNVMQAVSIFICGRLGTFELSVASFGYMFFSSTALMTAIGGSTAIDTMCSQAFGSAADAAGDARTYLGTVLQRGLIFLSVFFLAVIMPIWWHSGSLFHLLGQKEDFSAATQDFLKALIPAGILQVVAECLKKFLQVQNHRAAVGWCIGVAACIGTVMNYVLVLRTDLGVTGAAVAHAIYHFTTIATMVMYSSWSVSAREYWGGFTWKAFHDPWPFIVLALSGLLTVATEFWWYVSLFCGPFKADTVQLSKHSPDGGHSGRCLCGRPRHHHDIRSHLRHSTSWARRLFFAQNWQVSRSRNQLARSISDPDPIPPGSLHWQRRVHRSALSPECLWPNLQR